jgi:hypothetical protein
MVKEPKYLPLFLTQIFTICVTLSWLIKGFFNGKKNVGREFRRQKQSRERPEQRVKIETLAT